MTRTRLRAALLFCSLFIFTLAFLSFDSEAEATNVCGTISTNTTWTLAGSPYIVTCSITVSSSATLTIEAGVTVKFGSNMSMSVAGTLIANGTQASQITFTSSQATPTRGYWSRITFEPTSSASQLSYAVLYYGGGLYGAIYVNGSTPTIHHASVYYAKLNSVYERGFYVNNASINLDSINVISCGAGLVVSGSNSNVQVTNSILNDNATYGLDLRSGGGATISNSTLNNNSLYAIGAEANTRLISLSGLTMTGNLTGNGVGYRDGTITVNETWRSGITWFVGSVTVGSTATLTVEAGTTVKFGSAGSITVAGTLMANGTQASQITFASFQSSPTAGYWKHLKFEPTSSMSQLSYANVRHAGSSSGTGCMRESTLMILI